MGMGTRGEDNFATEGARDYVAMLTTQIVATINAIEANPSRLALDEDGESMLMPSVEILALLCERTGAEPPRPGRVRQWAKKYLDQYDATIDEQEPSEEYKSGRRKVIVNTFHWLESLAESYWTN
jgi:hypothetical protein